MQIVMKRAHSFFSIFFSLILVSCAHENQDIDFFIECEKTIAWNEVIACTIKDNDVDCGNIVWYVDGIEAASSSSTCRFHTGERELRHSVSAKYKDGSASACNELFIYNTKHLGLLKACYDFIDKYDIQTALSVSVKTKDDSFDFYTGYTSLKTKNICTDETCFYYYSITKTFVSALICTLVEENYLSFDDKISDVLDENLFDPSKINLNATIEQLLSHKSGIGEYATNYKIFLNNPFVSEEWSPIKILDFVDEDVLSDGNYVYSSANYIILGMIAEKVTGKKLSELLKSYFLNSLSLSTLKLSPQDTIDYSLISHPHVLANTSLNFGKSKESVDVTSLFPGSVMELIGKSSWAAGGFAGKSADGAVWIYELFSNNGSAVSDSVRELILHSTDEAYPGCDELSSFGLCGRRIFYKNDFFVGSYGRSVGSNNLAFYNAKSDAAFCILTSSNSDENGNPDVYELLCSLYEKIQN